MASAVIDGLTTRYEILGAGPPLLMYAPGGFNATVETWLTQGVYASTRLAAHLPAKFTCVLFDRRECGRSGGRIERVTWAHYVAQGRGLLDHLGIDRAHIMGCCPALAFAVAHPQRTLSLMLYWPVGGARYRITSHQRCLEYWDVPVVDQTEAAAPPHIMQFLDQATASSSGSSAANR